ncbi:hypothetical protein L6164_033721 [Bauhinia variegata]|uniref:Uncharacterized protein n=1 Tax=Bauhinia variegata TaxID=167791 RepID=A0ACB9KSQ6_BAUVA|nr:hypothetical protein L6164_033721 [Bauhinia variegata]
MESSNAVVIFDLQPPACSCSRDLSSSHYTYAGLQVSSLILPLEFLNGFARNPVQIFLLVLEPSYLLLPLDYVNGTFELKNDLQVGCSWKLGM